MITMHSSQMNRWMDGWMNRERYLLRSLLLLGDWLNPGTYGTATINYGASRLMSLSRGADGEPDIQTQTDNQWIRKPSNALFNNSTGTSFASQRLLVIQRQAGWRVDGERCVAWVQWQEGSTFTDCFTNYVVQEDATGRGRRTEKWIRHGSLVFPIFVVGTILLGGG